MTVNLDDVRCLLFEGKGQGRIHTRTASFIGSGITQHAVVSTACPNESICDFRIKYERCPTWEEIQLKYRQEDN